MMVYSLSYVHYLDMKRIKKIIFLTGATGHMGKRIVETLLHYKECMLHILVPPAEQKSPLVAAYQESSQIEIVWGNVCTYTDLLAGTRNADIVVHMAALVPPFADEHKELTKQVNYAGTQNLITAMQHHRNPGAHLVYISSIAVSGNRLPPVHWSRIGDPIQISSFDTYAASKLAAERAVIESSLPRWVCLRQTGILHDDLLKTIDPILYHHPLNTHMEWITAEDSARLISALCTRELPEIFWNNVYSVGGGAGFRLTASQFLEQSAQIWKIGDYKNVFEPSWFATRNFHGSWFLDSDILNNWLDFRKDSIDGYFKRVGKKMSRSTNFVSCVPQKVLKLFMKYIAGKKRGPLHWLRTNNIKKINAYWGSHEGWSTIPRAWSRFPFLYDPPAREISHGYRKRRIMKLKDLRDAADFRGGSCLSSEADLGPPFKRLLWECSQHHRFWASSFLILKAGHWCPHCDLNTDNYPRIAEKNQFLRQVLISNSEFSNTRVGSVYEAL